MAINIKDSGSTVISLKSTVSGGEHIPHHIVESSALPTGAATQATLAALLVELQAKADLSETQPISAVELPLPTGAASDAALAAILAELQAKADLSETQPVSVVGGASEATLDALLDAVVAQNGTASINVYVSSGNLASTSPVTVVGAAPGSTRHKVVGITLGNSSGTGTWVNLRSNGSPVFSTYLPNASNFCQEFGVITSIRGGVAQDLALETESVAAVRATIRYITEI